MFIGWLECDLELGDVHSLKTKRAVIRPILARLRRLQVSVAEVADAALYRRARIGVGVVSSDADTVTRLLDECERLVAAELEVTLLAARRHLVAADDFSG